MQFETIHPFLDGNGRLGRLLITFLLCAENALSEPLLYLSLYLKQHRSVYYDLLQRVRTEGDWEEWLRFFLEGVESTGEQASATARRILALLEKDRRKIESGRAAGTALRLHYLMRRRPLLSASVAAAELGLTFPTASAALRNLEAIGVVKEVPSRSRSRSRIYAYGTYLEILNEGTELPVRASMQTSGIWEDEGNQED